MALNDFALDLSRTFRGELFDSHHPSYESLRMAQNTRWDRKPRLIARCRCTNDVVSALRVAREHEFDVAVRGGGHHWAGLSTTDGVLIDLSLMRGVRVAPESKSARLEGGCLAGELQLEAGRAGLGAVTGLNEAVGMGLVLNGGIGNLSPRAGWACDQIVEADLVTADGAVVTASREVHPDLLAGVRGAAPNFGVVTSFVLQLHPVPNPVLAGSLRWVGLDKIRTALQWLARFLPGASDGLAMYGSITCTRPDPDVPQALHGRIALRMETVHVGPPGQAATEVGQIRSNIPPDFETVRPISFADLHLIPSPAKEPPWTRKASDEEVVTQLTGRVTDGVILHAAELERIGPRAGEIRMIEIYPHRGALARPPEFRSAIASRFPNGWSVMPIAFYADESQDAEQDEWVASIIADAQASGSGTGMTVGNMISAAPPDRMRAVFGASYDWLADLKATWDPENVFRGCLNVLPAPTSNSRPARHT